ncbi:MAG: M17 family peptidase N-terminal domain-containing protein, partial [Pseudomonadota bacterium]
MKFTFTDVAKADIVGFLIDQNGKLPNSAADLDEESGGLLTEALRSARFDGKVGQQAFIVLPSGASAKRALLIGAGKAKDRNARALERIGATVFKSQADSGFKSISIYAGSGEDAAQIAFGAKLAAYRFDEYRTKLKPDDKPSLTTVNLVTDDVKAAKAAFKPLDARADGTYLARDLVNLPPNDLYPASYAERIEALAEHGLEIEILGEKELADLGMNSMLGVGQGSVKESKLGIMKWSGGKSGDAPVALVGKGVCFDTGGISLKPGAGMEDMRGDMGGSAAVVGAMLSLAKRKAKANVVGLVGLVENMPDGDAIRPGDILKSASGQTIEVQNTDAEGRLVLC